jgi:hypothetical protein
MKGLVPALAVVLLGCAALGAETTNTNRTIDLRKINRTIAREPHYASAPKYCLMVFGPEARSHVWLVIDGDDLLVDRNGNGDLTERGERVPMKVKREAMGLVLEERQVEGGDIIDGSLIHTGLVVSQSRWNPAYNRSATPAETRDILENFFRTNPNGWVYMVKLSVELRPRPGNRPPIADRITAVAIGDLRGGLAFADRPQDAPILHFDGPLTMGLFPLPPPKLVRGEETDLIAFLGTSGLGKGTLTRLYYEGAIPLDGISPIAEVESPPKAPGMKPMKFKSFLTERC